MNTLKSKFPKNLCEELGSAIESGFYIAEKIKQKLDHKYVRYRLYKCMLITVLSLFFLQEREEWKYIAMVVDRIFLCLFLTISVLGIVILVVPIWKDTSGRHYDHAKNLITSD